MTRSQRGVWPQLVFMAAVAALTVFVFLARPAKGADYEVTNRVMPAFTVVNRVQPAPAGKAAGVVLPHSPVSTPAPVYQLVLFTDGVWRWVPVRPPQVMPAPGVAGTPTFHRSHTCPQCGLAQYVVERFNPDGTHTHRCARGHEWRH